MTAKRDHQCDGTEDKDCTHLAEHYLCEKCYDIKMALAAEQALTEERERIIREKFPLPENAN